MRKIIVVLAVLFTANLACKKEQIGDRLCACSPVTYPYLSLVIKNSADQDLLNPVIAGYYSQDQIQLFQKEGNGTIKQLSFAVRPPFSYGKGQFIYYQLFSQEIVLLAKATDQVFYLKLGDRPAFELNLQVNNNSRKVEKLFIDKNDAPIDTGVVSQYTSIFYLRM
ncbi:MAG: hypothetical protein V4541_14740 [Bacteroidota bacterium]